MANGKYQNKKRRVTNQGNTPKGFSFEEKLKLKTDRKLNLPFTV
jgi:hypothetical protein